MTGRADYAALRTRHFLAPSLLFFWLNYERPLVLPWLPTSGWPLLYSVFRAPFGSASHAQQTSQTPNGQSIKAGKARQHCRNNSSTVQPNHRAGAVVDSRPFITVSLLVSFSFSPSLSFSVTVRAVPMISSGPQVTSFVSAHIHRQWQIVSKKWTLNHHHHHCGDSFFLSRPLLFPSTAWDFFGVCAYVCMLNHVFALRRTAPAVAKKHLQSRWSNKSVIMTAASSVPCRARR